MAMPSVPNPGRSTLRQKQKNTVANTKSTSARLQTVRKKCTDRAQEVIDLCSDEEIIDLCSDEEVINLCSDEETTTPASSGESRVASVIQGEAPAFEIPTARMEGFGKNNAGTSASTQSFVTPTKSSGYDFITQYPGTSLRASPVVSQTPQHSPSNYSHSSSRIPTRPGRNSGGAFTSFTDSLGLQASTASKSSSTTPCPMLMQGICTDQTGSHHTITPTRPFYGLLSERQYGRQPSGQVLGSIERIPGVLGDQVGARKPRRDVNFSAPQTNNEKPFEHKVSREDGDIHMNDKPSNTDNSSSPLAGHNKANPPACPGQLLSTSASPISTAIPATPTTPNFWESSRPASTRKPDQRVHETPRTSSLFQMPNRSPRTLTKRRKVHDLSSSSDEADLFEPSSPSSSSEYDDGSSSSEASKTPTRTFTKIRTKPPAKRTRLATPPPPTPSKPKTPFRNEKKTKVGFKTPAPNHPSTPPPSTPANKTLPSRRAKLTAQKRNQHYLSQLRQPSTSPSETSDPNTPSQYTGVAVSPKQRGRKRGEEGLQTHIRQLSVTPAPSTISAADSTSASAGMNVGVSGRARADWMDWMRARAGGDRAVGWQWDGLRDGDVG
ncbi:hypothetical protein J1614_001615 [Plenodomus biglobosus]|nr:hypothetical protein J1614_001615 [Plenodomus biglobosus]